MIIKSHYSLLIALLLCTITSPIFGEGTKQVAPNSSITINGNSTHDIAALLIDHDSYNNFASYTNPDPNSRLYIHITDPTTECIYLGFSLGHVNGTSPTPATLNYEYRIKDPNGNVVFGPITVTPADANINNWQEAVNGPSQIFGAGGYNAQTVSATDLSSQGWTGKGDFYIEFTNTSTVGEVLIDYWDITVSNCGATSPTAIDGRVWSFNWAFFAVNDFGFPERPFNGSFHVCAPDPDDDAKAFITKIDFNGAGFQPAAFNVAFNSFGSQNTGDIASDRRSRENVNSTQSEYEIFLNDPVDLCETAEPGLIELQGIGRCSPDDYCVQFSTSKEGLVELLLDFDGGDNVFTPGTADVIISTQVDASQIGQLTCIDWNGLDGLGNPLDEVTSTTIPITIAFAQGIYHFPIYDAEYMFNGFQITAVRPAGPVPNLYYDDTQITVPSGSGEADLQLTGCNLPCHRWTNYIDGNTPGFGNLHTINSWWFSQLVVEDELLFIPATYTCDIMGNDTLCEGEVDTLFADLTVLPLNISAPSIDSYSWSGPGIVGPSDGQQIIIDQPGIYTIMVNWVNNLDQACTTTCSKEIFEGFNCCAPQVFCDPLTTWYPCEEDAPAPANSIDELISSGLISVFDRQCANLNFTVDALIAGSGCASDPTTTTYTYELWNDANDNGIQDLDENSIFCEQQYLSADTTEPSVTFSGDLEGFQSGDTMMVACQSGDSTWSIPQPSILDISVTEGCSDFVVELSDVVVEASDCETDGYILFYTCTWMVIDDCDNEDEIVLYMMIVDETPPLIMEVAPDITISCTDEIPPAYSLAIDECNCAHEDIDVDTLLFLCPAQYTLQRTYTWTDHCGNSSSAIQVVTIDDEAAIELNVPDILSNYEIETECEQGGLPMWIGELNANSISAFGNCSGVSVDYAISQIEGSDCLNGYLSKYELTWTATDACGNEAIHENIVTIVDHTPPVILAYPAVCDENFDPNEIQILDNCSATDFTYYTETLSSSCTNGLDTRHVWEVSDLCGNMTIGEIIEHSGDNNAPTITLRPPNQNLGSGSQISLPCTTTPLSFEDLNLVDIQDECGVQSVDFIWSQIDGANCADLHLGIYQLEWFATDGCQNEAHFVLFVEISAPDLTSILPNEIIIGECDIDLDDIVSSSCNVSLNLLESQLQSACSAELSFQVYELVSPCGETITDTIFLDLNDTQGPVFNELPETICASDDVPTAIAFDVCMQANVPVTVDQIFEQYCGINYRVLEFTATDDCGNQTVEKVTILPTLLDEAFDIFYGSILLVESSTGWPTITTDCSVELDESLFNFEPNCSLLELNITKTTQELSCELGLNAIHEYEITLESSCGVQEVVRFIHQTNDEIAPIFLDPPADISIGCNDSIVCPSIEVWDNCSDVDVAKEEIDLPGLPGAVYVMQMWTATDGCGQTATHERVVTKFDAPTCEIVGPEIVPCLSIQRLEAEVVSLAEPLTYEWKVLSGQCTIESQNENLPYIDVIVFGGEAIVQLTVTDAYGCSSFCEFIISCLNKPDNPGNSLNDGSTLSSTLAIYPNPVSSIVHIESAYQIQSLTIKDTHGRSLKRYSSHFMQSQIDISDLPKGILIFELEDELGTMERRKVVHVEQRR